MDGHHPTLMPTYKSTHISQVFVKRLILWLSCQFCSGSFTQFFFFFCGGLWDTDGESTLLHYLQYISVHPLSFWCTISGMKHYKPCVLVSVTWRLISHSYSKWVWLVDHTREREREMSVQAHDVSFVNANQKKKNIQEYSKMWWFSSNDIFM